MKLPALGTLAALALVLGSSLSARAWEGDPFFSETQMVGITSSYPSGYHGRIVTTLDDAQQGSIVGFRFEDSRGTTLSYSVEQLRQGVVILSAFGKTIISIRGPNFTADAGGTMTITFLRRFFSDDSRQVKFDYVRAQDGSWALLTHDALGQDPFDSLAIEVYKSFGIPSGVDEVDLGLAGTIERRYDPNTLPRTRRGRRRFTCGPELLWR